MISSLLAETAGQFPIGQFLGTQDTSYFLQPPLQLDSSEFSTLEYEEKRCICHFLANPSKSSIYGHMSSLPCPNSSFLWLDEEKHKDLGSHVSKITKLNDGRSLES